MRALDASLIFVIFSHLTGLAHFDHHEFHVPKQQLVSMLQVLMQTGRIHLPRTQEAKAMPRGAVQLRAQDAQRRSARDGGPQSGHTRRLGL